MDDTENPEPEETTSLHFRLAELNVNEFFFRSESEHNELEEGAEYVLEHGVRLSDDVDQIHIRARVTLQEGNEEEMTEIGGAAVTGYFDVRNLEPEGDDEVFLPDRFVGNLLGIVISSVRGVLISYGSGTPLEEHLLPVLNPTQLVANTDYGDSDTSDAKS